ncbi:MAG: VWA domain-containing protein [Bryobacteraceae bacterium]
MKAAAGLFLGALFASGQQPAAPAPDSQQPATVFRVTSTLVQVDAVVTDSKGHHITDLKPEEFQVFEDGKLQKLTHFSYVQVTPELEAAREKLSPKPVDALPPPPLAQLRPEDVRRTIVLMVDDLGLSFESMALVRRSLRRFVNEQMQPGDLVAICRTGAGSGALQQFSADKRVLLSIINGLRWNPNGRFGATYFDPYGKYSSWEDLIGSVPSGGSGPDDARSSALATVGTLGAVNYIVGALREMPGRKSIVLFSDGLQMFEAGVGPHVHRANAHRAHDAPESYADVVRVLRLLIDRANRSGTVIYTMRATGAQTLQPGAEDNPELTETAGVPGDTTLNNHTHVGVNDERDLSNEVQEENLAYLAGQTGGLAYDNGNDMNWGLARVLEDQAGYYLLGYHPLESTWQGKNGGRGFHRIQVKVTRAGLQVRSRSGFFGETDDETVPKFNTPIEQLRAAMLSPFKSSGVGLRLTALYAEVPKRGPVVRNLLRINAADLSWEHDLDGSDRSRVMLFVVATGAGDQPLAAVGRIYNVQVAAGRMTDALRDGALYTLDVPVPKRGAYQIRAAVRDEATGKIGSATQFIEIPNLKKARLALASVILRDGERSPWASELLDITPALRQFKRGGLVEFLCAIENGAKKRSKVDLETRVRVLRDGKEIYSAPAKLVEMKDRGPAAFGALKLADRLTPGDYDLQVIATEQQGGKAIAASQWTDFTVLP